MRRTLQIALGAAVLLLAGATAFYYSQYQKSQASYTSVKASEQSARDQYAQTINAIAEIQDSLNALSPGETRVLTGSTSLQAERELGMPDNHQILERIAQMRAGLMRNRDRIATLERNLHHSGLRVAGLQRMVANLKETATQKEQQIAELTSQIGQLQTQVTGLTTQVAQTQDTVRTRDDMIAQKQHDLATVYYVAGTKRELARSGVIVAKGGLLGIGKTLLPSTRVADAVFKPIDTDEETTLPLGSTRAQVLTAQPASSYEMRLVNGRMQLHILDPTEFRRIRQLVIVTA